MKNIYLRAAALGVVAGMRSMLAPAAVSRHYAKSPSSTLARSPLGLLGHQTTANVLALMASGEFTGDKLPNAPNRIAPGPLGGRAVMGGICGAAVALASDDADGAENSALLGAAVGAAAAVASTFATFYLRRYLVAKTRLPDPIIAAGEDALAVGLASRVFTGY